MHWNFFFFFVQEIARQPFRGWEAKQPDHCTKVEDAFALAVVRAPRVVTTYLLQLLWREVILDFKFCSNLFGSLALQHLGDAVLESREDLKDAIGHNG